MFFQRISLQPHLPSPSHGANLVKSATLKGTDNKLIIKNPQDYTPFDRFTINAFTYMSIRKTSPRQKKTHKHRHANVLASAPGLVLRRASQTKQDVAIFPSH